MVFTAAAASKLGTQVSYIAIPLLAVVALHATPYQVGLLGTLATLPFLLISLPAGAWADRLRKRRLQIAADLSRAALFGSVPIAWCCHLLSLWQLYLVVLLSGAATVFFDIAAQSFLPFLVGRPSLMAANSALASTDAINQVAGRSVGGYLVQLLTAPVAVAVDAASYLWSAAWLIRVRRDEPKSERKPDVHLLRESREGLVFVLGHPLLRPIAVSGALTNFFVQISVVMLPVLFVRDLKLPPSLLGAYLACGGAGVFLGTTNARRVGNWLGYGRAMWIVGLVSAPLKFVIPFLDRGPMLWLAALGWLLATFQVGINNVLQVSFRQRATPDRLLGRMNAAMRFLLTGALALGSALAGLLGQYVGVRAVLWVGAAGLATAWLPSFLSPLRTMRQLPR